MSSPVEGETSSDQPRSSAILAPVEVSEFISTAAVIHGADTTEA